MREEGEPDMELLELLVHGIEPEHSFDLMTSAAVARGDTGVCRFLLAHGADIDALRQGCKQTERCSALQHAGTSEDPRLSWHGSHTLTTGTLSWRARSQRRPH